MPGPTATDSNFERTFADLAYARLRDKAPSLLDYLLGFQLIEKNDDETHAVGVFGFKVGREWVYCPVFFINGELKGHELMYIKSQDAFVPMTEQWVNYVLNRRPRVLGENEKTPRGELGIRQPDFDVFARSPMRGSKSAAAKAALWESLSRGPRDERYSTLDKRFDLYTVMAAFGKQAAINLFATMEQDSKFADAILKFYDVKTLIKRASEKMTADEAGYQGTASFSKCAGCKHYSGNRSCDLVEGDISPEGTCKHFSMKTVNSTIKPIDAISDKYASEKAIVITRGDDGSSLMQDMTDSEKKKLLKDQYVIRDKRGEGSKASLYKSQFAATINSPHASGMYDVLMIGGDTKKTVVIQGPKQIGWSCSGTDHSVVIDLDGKQFSNYHNSDILTTKDHGMDEYAKWYKGLSAGDSVSEGETAILVGPKGEGTFVFTVDHREDKDGHVELKVWGKGGLSASAVRNTSTRACSDNVDTLVFSGKPGVGMTQLGSCLFIPDGYKAYTFPKPKGTGRPSYVGESSGSMLLGTLGSILYKVQKEASLGEKIATLELKTDGIRFTPHINGRAGPALSKVAALKWLIEKQQLGQEDAEMVVKEAHPRKRTEYYIKYAYHSASNPPDTAEFPDPHIGSDPGSNIPVQYPQTNTQQLGQYDPQAAADAYGTGDRYIDNGAKQHAQAASGQGQKEILDTAVITGLVRTMDTDHQVDSYIGDLLLGLDRIGRIYFQYLWHNDKFKERYGAQDMAELEDNLKNVFKSLGELTLFLKQKTVQADQAETSEVELQSVVGE